MVLLYSPPVLSCCYKTPLAATQFEVYFYQRATTNASDCSTDLIQSKTLSRKTPCSKCLHNSCKCLNGISVTCIYSAVSHREGEVAVVSRFICFTQRSVQTWKGSHAPFNRDLIMHFLHFTFINQGDFKERVVFRAEELDYSRWPLGLILLSE